jgi:hypothetical protein
VAVACLQGPARPAAAPTAPAPAAAPTRARAEATDLLGAAGSARTAGDLWTAWNTGRQAAAKDPTFTEARQFVAAVEAAIRLPEARRRRVAEPVLDREALAGLHEMLREELARLDGRRRPGG